MTTIFAIATPMGRSGVSIVRISGDKAYECLNVFGIDKEVTPRMAHLLTLKNPSSKEIIDRAIVIHFPAPASFTGEDIIEFHLHGSPAIIKETLKCLEDIKDFRYAEAGEFTRRALYNNKMNLAEAEGLIDLINSETAKQKQQAIRQMDGELTKICQNLRTDIISVRANLEAYLDFPDEDLPENIIEKLDEKVANIEKTIKNLLDDNKKGEKIREGFVGVILGKPNVGKSTLINALSGRDVAIVSDIAGTTRDIIEVSLDIGGYVVSIADTAGLRKAKDKIEKEGLDRAKKYSEKADFKIFIYDGLNLDKDLSEINKNANIQDTVVVINKSDIMPQNIDNNISKNVIFISAKHKEGIDKIIDKIESYLHNHANNEFSPAITRNRHRTGFADCLESITRFYSSSAIEIKAEELRLAANSIGSIIGFIGLEDVLDDLFSSFCIGK